MSWGPTRKLRRRCRGVRDGGIEESRNWSRPGWTSWYCSDAGQGEPGAPEGIDEGVGGGRGHEAASAAISGAVEPSGDGGEDHVAPVGARRVVDVAQSEEDRGHSLGAGAGGPGGFEKVLDQTAEVELFGDGDEEEDGDEVEGEIPR